MKIRMTRKEQEYQRQEQEYQRQEQLTMFKSRVWDLYEAQYGEAPVCRGAREWLCSRLKWDIAPCYRLWGRKLNNESGFVDGAAITFNEVRYEPVMTTAHGELEDKVTIECNLSVPGRTEIQCCSVSFNQELIAVDFIRGCVQGARIAQWKQAEEQLSKLEAQELKLLKEREEQDRIEQEKREGDHCIGCKFFEQLQRSSKDKYYDQDCDTSRVAGVCHRYPPAADIAAIDRLMMGPRYRFHEGGGHSPIKDAELGWCGEFQAKPKKYVWNYVWTLGHVKTTKL